MKLALRITLFLSLTALAILSMLIGGTVETRLVYYYFLDWGMANYFYRIFILFALISAFLILFGSEKKWLKISVIFISLFILLDTLLYFSGFTEHRSLFYYSRYKVLFFIGLASLLVGMFFFVKQKGQSKSLKGWMIIASILASIGLSLIRVVYIEDWSMTPTNEKKIEINQIKDLAGDAVSKELDGNKILVAFLSTTCPHCYESATKMAISKKKNILPPTVLFFPEIQNAQEKVTTFLEDTKLTGVPYVILPPRKFVETGGTRMPSIFLLENNESTQWIGSQFNNFVLSHIEPN